MGVANEGQYGYLRLYDVAQCEHLTGFADAGFEYSHLALFVQKPNRQRHTNLRVVAAWRASYIELGREELV